MRTARTEPAVKSALRLKRSKIAFIAAIGMIVATRSLMLRALPEPTSEPLKRTGIQSDPKSSNLITSAAKAHLVESYGKTPLSFEMNQGQTDRRVKFLSRGSGYNLFLTGDEAILALQESGAARQESTQEPPSLFVTVPLQKKTESGRGTKGKEQARNATLRMKLVGANSNAAVIGLDELPGKTNYFIGNDSKEWRTNVPTYARVKYESIYPGVDLVYYGNHVGELEYDFVVSPGANPKAITFDIAGDEVTPISRERRSPLRLGTGGELLLQTGGGHVRFKKPIVYQEDHGRRHYIDGQYLLQAEESDTTNSEYPKSRISFELAAYDHSKLLVIDPAIAYSTFLGGTTEGSGGTAIAVFADPANGHTYAYVAGGTCAPDFPIVSATQPIFGGCSDAFVTKFDPSATGSNSVVYSSYLGGTGADSGTGIAVDSFGNAYITGLTDSTNFPKPNAYQTFLKSRRNAFLAKISADGSSLPYSTYFGGTVAEGDGYNFMAITLDTAGHAYIAGQTRSTDLPIVNPYQAVLRSPDGNAFVAEFDTTLPGPVSLVYSTYLGGPGSCAFGSSALGIAVDSAGAIHLAGSAGSTSFPVVNGFQTASNTCNSGFYAQLNPHASSTPQLVYSTYLSSPAFGVGLDSSGNAYLAGGFVTKINPLLSGAASLVYSAPMPAGFSVAGIAVNASGNAFIVGSALPGMPLVNPVQSSANGVMQSVDAGQKWTGLTQGLNDFPITALAVDASTSPRTIYAGTAACSIFATTDGGLNWNRVFQTPNASCGNPIALAIDPATPSNVYAGTSAGVYKSSDRGLTWSAFNNGLSSDVWVQALVFDAGTLYAGGHPGLYKLSPGATSWASTTVTQDVQNIAIDTTTAPHTMYAVSFYMGTVFYKSTDGGDTWLAKSTYPGNGGVSAMGVDTATTPSSTLYAYVAGGYPAIWKSVDGGNSWDAASDPGPITDLPTSIYVDTTTTPSSVYVLDPEVGIFKSINGGSSWTFILPTQLRSMAVDPTTANGPTTSTLYAGTFHAFGNAFVAELNSSGSSFLFSTYLGGIASDSGGSGIALDPFDNIYITGATNPRPSLNNFPTVNAFQATASVTSAFFTKLGSQTLPPSSSGSVTTQVGVQTGTLGITFPNITGSTTSAAPTVTVTPLSSATIANFSLSNNLGGYDISTTALYSGSITLCFQALTVNDISTFNNLEIIHIVNGAPLNVTSSRNFSTRTVCGSATSLSPFILVNGMPTITWNNPSNIVYGTALGGAQLNATANVPGTFVYTPASGTILGPGSGQKLSVTFRPTNTAIYATATKMVTINVLYAACDGGPGHTILQPINADGSSVFKLGSTVPTKFRVCDAHGVSVGLAGTVASYQLVAAGSATGLTVDEQVYSTAGDTKFRWDSTAQQWIFNQATGKNNTTLSQANTIYTFRINLKDGTYIQFQYGLK